jgi:Tfp pilus assembly protein PilO
MGWGRMLLLGNIGQQMDIQEQKDELQQMRRDMLRRRRREAAGTAARLEELEAENDELRLYMAAIVRLLVSKGVASREEMAELVATIDAEDGAADGRFGGPIA